MQNTPKHEKTMAELFEAAELSPKELAELLDIPLDVITSAAFAGDLKATIVNHDIISIKRDDALAWMASR